jgi:hypothetical protein
MSRGSGARFIRLTERAAAGDRDAARQLILGGWWPENWDADDEAAQDLVIAGSQTSISNSAVH